MLLIDGKDGHVFLSCAHLMPYAGLFSLRFCHESEPIQNAIERLTLFWEENLWPLL